MTERFIAAAPSPGHAYDALKPAVDWMAAQASAGGHAEVVVVVPQVNSIREAAPAFGADPETLRDTQRLEGTPVSWVFHIKSSLPQFGPLGRPVLAAWVDDALLQRVEALAPPLLCVLPWLADDVNHWTATYAPIGLATGQPTGGAPPISDETVLETLNVVRSRGGVTHPYDREAAVKALRKLRKAATLPHPDALRAWAIAAHLSLEDAAQLAEWAQNLHDGRTVRAR